MSKPFISVIVPTLNEEKYLENCLKSIRNQDYDGRYEIIVSDSKSKDGTLKIAKKYVDKIIVTGKKGISLGRNAGAKAAKGKILLFLDADTTISFNTLSEISKAFKKKEIIGATCPIVPLSANVRDFIIYWVYDQFAKASIKTKNPHIAGMFCAYRKDVFEKIGGFDENLDTYEDYDLSKRISDFGKITFVDSALAITSPRRIETWGRTKAAGKYLTSYLNYLITGNGFNPKKYKPVR